MNYRIGFRFDWLELITFFIIIFFAGILVSGNNEHKFLYTGLLLVSAGILIIKKKIKIPIE